MRHLLKGLKKNQMETLKYSRRLTSVEGGKILKPSLQSLEELAHLGGASEHPAKAPTTNHYPHQHPKLIQLQ